MKKILRVLCLFLSVLLIFSGCAANVQYGTVKVKPYNMKWENNGDIETIRKRIAQSLLNPEVEGVEEDLKCAKPDGSFSNVDYDSSKTDTWHPIDHLKKVLNLQIAYNTPEHPYYRNKEIKPVVKKAMEYWAKGNFKCDWNWWWNGIGVGLYLPDIIILGVDGMTQETKNMLLSSLHESLIQNEEMPENIKERAVDATGGNLTDKVISSLKVAVIENDGNTIMWLKSLLENELRVFPAYSEKYTDRSDCEGIKEDMSFQQHDQLIYFGGYGDVFMTGIGSYLTFTKDTQFELSDRAVNLYSDLLLDGMQYAVRNGYKDINSTGRGAVRTDGTKGLLGNLRKNAEILLTYKNVKRSDELMLLLKNRTEKNDMGAGGYRYFYESDAGIYNGKNYMATVRHAGPRTRIYEEINGENPLGYYTGLGATALYVDGNEFTDLLPLIDWNRIPGTTTRQGHLPIYGDNSYGLYNKYANAGGASIKSAGVSFLNSYTENVKSKKAYFMFEDGVVCLGADISCNKQDKIITNINQAHLKGDIKFSVDGKIESAKFVPALSRNFDFIYHNKISYISPDKIRLTTQHISSDWKKINTHFANNKPIEGDVISLDILHGSRPKNAKYEYTALMNTTPEKTQKYIENPTLKVLRNDKRVQSVYDAKNGILCAVFYEKGELTLLDSRKISVDAPCVLILKGGSATVSSANYDSYKVNVTLEGKTLNFNAGAAGSQKTF